MCFLVIFGVFINPIQLRFAFYENFENKRDFQKQKSNHFPFPKIVIFVKNGNQSFI